MRTASTMEAVNGLRPNEDRLDLISPADLLGCPLDCPLHAAPEACRWRLDRPLCRVGEHFETGAVPDSPLECLWREVPDVFRRVPADPIGRHQSWHESAKVRDKHKDAAVR